VGTHAIPGGVRPTRLQNRPLLDQGAGFADARELRLYFESLKRRGVGARTVCKKAGLRVVRLHGFRHVTLDEKRGALHELGELFEEET
jgi:hypothetical protein